MQTLQYATILPVFNTERFLKIKQMAFKYFMAERLNFGLNPTVKELMEYLSYYVADNEMPTIQTVARWQSSWKRSS